MHQVGFDCVGAFPHRCADQLSRRLEDQELVLQSVLNRFDAARRELELQSVGVGWRGPAQLLYTVGLCRLRSELASAAMHLEAALTQTRWAIASREKHG